MTNNLKELTRPAHRIAERQKFAKVLLSGKISPEMYHFYLYNQYHNYRALEEKLDIPEINRIKRHHLIFEDIKELENDYNINPEKPLCKTTMDYVKYVSNLEDNDKILTHVYVRHFGDMHGGQIIKKQTPGSGKMYDFEDPENLIITVRSLLDDSMKDEAVLCFQYATNLFKELIEYVPNMG